MRERARDGRTDQGSAPRNLAWICPALAFLVPFLVYLRTLARDVVVGDSGELAAAAISLGIAHPPGYPAFVLLGHILSRLPVGAPVFRVGLLSALAAAGACWLLFRAAASIRFAPGGRESSSSAAGALCGVLLFAFARTVWSQATIVEVYALQAFLVAAFFAAALAPAPASTPAGATAPRDLGSRPVHARRRALAGLCFGLSLTNHLNGALLAPSFLVWLILEALRTRREGRRWWTAIPRPVLWSLAPLALYLYLPIRSRLDPAVNWDFPETWRRFLVHVSARQYHGHLGRQGIRLEEARRFLFEQLPAEATILLPLLAAAGVAVLARSRPRVLLVTVPFLLAVLVFNAAYPIHDIGVYYLPALLVLSLWAACGAGWLGGMAHRWGRPASVLFSTALLTLPAIPLARSFRAMDRSESRLVSTYVRDAVRWADSGAVLFSADWDRFSSPFLYLQSAEGLRGDLILLDQGRLASPTLDRSLRRVFPELADACGREIAAGAALAGAAERGEPYDLARARETYRGLQRALVRESIRRRTTYAVAETYLHPMYGGYFRYPEGLLVRLSREPSDRDFPPAPADSSGRAAPLFEGPATTAGDLLRPQERELVEDYRRALDRRIRHLEQTGRPEEVAALRKMMELLPR